MGESDLRVLLHVRAMLPKRDIIGYHMLRSDGILGGSLKLRAPLASKAFSPPWHGGYKVGIFAIISGVQIGVEASGGRSTVGSPRARGIASHQREALVRGHRGIN